jgi:hypothetical protein
MFNTSTQHASILGRNLLSLELGFEDDATASRTGNYLTLAGQNETGTTSIGGNVVITSGTGTSSAGSVSIQAGGTTLINITSASVTLGATSSTALAINATVSSTASTTVSGPALPALAKGYLIVDLNGTSVKIPYYTT